MLLITMSLNIFWIILNIGILTKEKEFMYIVMKIINAAVIPNGDIGNKCLADSHTVSGYKYAYGEFTCHWMFWPTSWQQYLLITIFLGQCKNRIKLKR